MDTNKKNKHGKLKWFAIGATLTAAGFIVIPRLIKKYGTKVYKNTLNTSKIDFDNMGPEVVPFESKTQEEKACQE